MSEARFTVEYKIGYAEGQRDAEKIKVERAVKEADELRAKVAELEAEKEDASLHLLRLPDERP